MPHHTLALLPLLALASCPDTPSASSDHASLPMTTVVAEQYSGIESERHEAIQDAGTWEARWAEIYGGRSPQPPIPDVDFGRDMLVLVALGLRGNGCSSVEIDAVEQADARLRVRAHEQVPGPACLCTQALVYPVHVVSVPRTDAVLELDLVERPMDC